MMPKKINEDFYWWFWTSLESDNCVIYMTQYVEIPILSLSHEYFFSTVIVLLYSLMLINFLIFLCIFFTYIFSSAACVGIKLITNDFHTVYNIHYSLEDMTILIVMCY